MTTIAGYIVLALLLFGVNTVIWTAAGLVRWASELARGRFRRGRRAGGAGPIPQPDAVAVLMAAHNEAGVIASSIASAARLVPAGQIFVVSDGSTDDTVALVKDAGANVLDLQPNRGKAGALAAGVAEFELAKRFDIVMILDADTEPDSDYLTTGLPLFADESVAVVAGRATTQWDAPDVGVVGRILLAHRERMYCVVQRLIKYGQGHEAIDAINIAPGFATMYRAAVLRDIDMNPPGLVIEDFNMTFEIHHRGLGRVAFHPGAAVARTQDPAHLAEYVRQVHRWSLGFWQTVRLHGWRHVGLFWASVAVYSVELVIGSITLLFTAAVIVIGTGVMATTAAVGVAFSWPVWLPTLDALVVVVVVPDLVVTAAVAVGQRRITMLAAAPAFPILRVVDAWLVLASLAASFRTASSGTWVSPTRRLAADAASR